MSQISFRWVKCRDQHEVLADTDGNRFLVPKSGNMEVIKPLEINNALWRQLENTAGNEGKIIEFANSFGMLEPVPNSIDSYNLDAHEFPKPRREPIAAWKIFAHKLHHVINRWDTGDIIEVARTINNLELSGLNLSIEPQKAEKVPLLCIGCRSLKDAIWVQLIHSITQNQRQRSCLVCGNWFSYGDGTNYSAKRIYCSDKCRNRFHETNRPGRGKTNAH